MLQFRRFCNRLYHSIPKHYGSLAGLGLLSCSFTFSLLQTTATTQTISQPSTTVGEAEIGWEFLGSRDLNQTAITETQYYGDCPGKETSAIESKFTSSKTPPASDRRVIVRNITRGLSSDPYPYTNREYNRGRSSESTYMLFGTRHDDKHLVVLKGENTFEYEIRQRDQVIDSGTFNATIDLNQNPQERKAVERRERVCFNTQVPLNVCADIRTQIKFTCPDGKVVRSQLEPNIREFYTLIANRSNVAITFSINQQREVLFPGESRTFSGSPLYITFQSCSNCNFQTTRLQAGRRYQFSTRNLSSNLQIDLSSYPNNSF